MGSHTCKSTPTTFKTFCHASESKTANPEVVDSVFVTLANSCSEDLKNCFHSAPSEPSAVMTETALSTSEKRDIRTNQGAVKFLEAERSVFGK